MNISLSEAYKRTTDPLRKVQLEGLIHNVDGLQEMTFMGITYEWIISSNCRFNSYWSKVSKEDHGIRQASIGE